MGQKRKLAWFPLLAAVQQHARDFHLCLLLVLMTMVTHGALTVTQSVNVSARQVHLLMAHVKKYIILGIDCINTSPVMRTKVVLLRERYQIRIYNIILHEYTSLELQ